MDLQGADMTLKDRLVSHGISVQTLAKQLGVNRGHLHTVLTGWRGRRPCVPFAKKIEAATGGLIKWMEFYCDEPISHSTQHSNKKGKAK